MAVKMLRNIRHQAQSRRHGLELTHLRIMDNGNFNQYNYTNGMVIDLYRIYQ